MKLARKSIIRHPAGINIETPLLIPSFSSKGLLLKEPKAKSKESEYDFFQSKTELDPETNLTTGHVSEATDILMVTAESITEVMLVSAYDIYHRHIPLPYESVMPELFVVDSGGYEIDDVHDYSDVMHSTGPINEWDVDKYKEVLDMWPEHIPAAFVSYDGEKRGKPLCEQIESAKELFGVYKRKQLCIFLIKPVSEKGVTFQKTVKEICRNIDDLGDFDAIAMTEKDLGDSVLQNMENIAKIRQAMDDVKLDIPIHIFGGLDPLLSSLYFLAGAEIFDGLTWIRYGYFEGRTMYYRNHGILNLGVHEKNALARARTVGDNIFYLRDLQEEMKEYLNDLDISAFQYNSEILKKAFNRLRTKFEGRDI